MLILRTGSIMTIGFEKIFLMQTDLNLRASEVISTYVYKMSLKASIPDFSYSTAIGLFNSIVNLFIILRLRAGLAIPACGKGGAACKKSLSGISAE